MEEILGTFFKWGIIIVACIMFGYTVIRLCLPVFLVILGLIIVGFIAYCAMPLIDKFGTGPFICMIFGALVVIAFISWIIKSFFNLFK